MRFKIGNNLDNLKKQLLRGARANAPALFLLLHSASLPFDFYIKKGLSPQDSKSISF
jgi:hypothetical protein